MKSICSTLKSQIPFVSKENPEVLKVQGLRGWCG